MREKLEHLKAEALNMNENPMVPRTAKLNLLALVSLLEEIVDAVDALKAKQ